MVYGGDGNEKKNHRQQPWLEDKSKRPVKLEIKTQNQYKAGIVFATVLALVLNNWNAEFQILNYH